MPIPVQKLEEVSRAMEDRILVYMRESPETAYSAFDLWVALDAYDRGMATVAFLMWTAQQQADRLAEVSAGLQVLMHRGAVRAVQYQGQAFYALATK